MYMSVCVSVCACVCALTCVFVLECSICKGKVTICLEAKTENERCSMKRQT